MLGKIAVAALVSAVGNDFLDCAVNYGKDIVILTCVVLAVLGEEYCRAFLCKQNRSYFACKNRRFLVYVRRIVSDFLEFGSFIINETVGGKHILGISRTEFCDFLCFRAVYLGTCRNKLIYEHVALVVSLCGRGEIIYPFSVHIDTAVGSGSIHHLGNYYVSTLDSTVFSYFALHDAAFYGSLAEIVILGLGNIGSSVHTVDVIDVFALLDYKTAVVDDLFVFVLGCADRSVFGVFACGEHAHKHTNHETKDNNLEQFIHTKLLYRR